MKLIIKNKFFGLGIIALLVCFFAPVESYSATPKAANQRSVIQSGTKVRAKVEATGLYSEDCYNSYYGCMDQFCLTDNASGGSCSCSDENAGYEKQLANIEKQLSNANQISTIEVEKIKAGAQADIIFSGERQYDAEGNVIQVGEQTEEQKRADKKAKLEAVFNQIEDDEETEDESIFETDSIANKTGDALYLAADDLCVKKVSESCSTDLVFLQKMYQTQIKSDCKAFANDVKEQQTAADLKLASAKSDVRGALKESFAAANAFDRGTCMVNFKKCMQGNDACGSDWKNCVSTIASENMQNEKTKSVAGTKVKTVDKYTITDSTMEILDSKRNICENILDKCVAVRDYIWDDFLREAAPTIHLAELNAESNMRQSCLSDISNCIQKACKDDIAGKGTATMDACLSRPDMARSFCKVQIDPCERMQPLIWGYVKDKLAAMRVDACTAEVKNCFTADDRCGENFVNCIGMDYDYIHDICPIDKLVVCKANKKNFSMDDLDSMLMGIYLNIDNSALENCQNLVNAKMSEVCGSTTDCNKFMSDETLGTGSIRSQKNGSLYRVTGMISFGSIVMGDASGKTRDGNVLLEPGQIGVAGYIEKVRENNKIVPNSDAIIPTIEEELNNISGTINRTIEMIQQDPKIQYCVYGRDLSQITGQEEQTKARFPNLLNQVKMQIAVSALSKAQDNYNAKLNKEISSATKNASADVAQYLCQKIASNVGYDSGLSASSLDTEMAPPYSISYDVDTGLSLEDLTKGGSGTSEMSIDGVKQNNSRQGKLNKSNRQTTVSGGATTDSWSTFNRETRICHLCRSTVTVDCSSKKSSGFLGIGASNKSSCDTSEPVETCEDIPM